MASERRDPETSSEKTAPLGHDDSPMDLSSDDAKAEAPACPDGGYGWVVVAGVFLINMHSWGLNSSYGVFLAYFVNNDTYPDARGSIDYAFIAGLSIGSALLIAPITTKVVHLFGTRFALLCGCLLETLALISSSFTTRIWQLYLSQGLCFGFSLGFLFISSVGLIPQWFDKKRSFANAIGAAGSGLGGLVYNLASEAVMQRAGYRWAYRTIGICAFVVTLICAFLVKDRNEAVGARLKPWDFKLGLRFEFIFLQAWGWLSLLGYLVLIYTLPTYATSIGLTSSQGSIVGAILNLGQAVGRPLVGLTSDRVGRINIATSLTALCGVLCLVWWIFAKSFGVLVALAFVIGTLAGTYWATIAPVATEVIGLRDLPCVLSMTWVVVVPPTIFSEAIALEIREHSGFFYAQLYTGLCYLAAAVCLWVVRTWKIGQNEQLAAAHLKPTSSISPREAAAAAAAQQNGDRSMKTARSSAFKRAMIWTRV